MQSSRTFVRLYLILQRSLLLASDHLGTCPTSPSPTHPHPSFSYSPFKSHWVVQLANGWWMDRTGGTTRNLSMGLSGTRCPEANFSAYLTLTAFQRERAGLPNKPQTTQMNLKDLLLSDVCQ